MKWLVAPATVLLGFAALLFFAGSRSCAESSSARLVEVLEMAPTEAEVGDRVALLGTGFPTGKPARVTFRGALYRPGEGAITDAEIVLPGIVVGPQRVEVSFDDETQAIFCGGADRAIHTTFAGDVEVAFAAAAPGAPPVAGVLRNVTLDVRPSTSPSAARLAARDGERVLDWIGVKTMAGGSGLFVEAVGAGSLAAQAGIAPGDTLATLDGVRLASAGDFLPSARDHEALIGVRHSRGSNDSMVRVSLQGFRRAPPSELLGAALVVIAALAVVVLFGAPTHPRLAAAIHRVALRASAASVEARTGGGGVARLVSKALRWGAWGAPDWVEAAACGGLVALPFGQYVVAARLDVALLFVSAVSVLVAAVIVARGSPASGWTPALLLRASRDAAHVAWQHVPAALAVASVVVATGSLRIHEIEHAQGGAPWEWLAFHNPALLVAFLSLLTCARIEPDARNRVGFDALLEERPATAFSTRGSFLESACRVHRTIVAGMASSLFLGGWLLPGLSAPEQDSRALLEMAGAMLFLVKTVGLAWAIGWMRRVLPMQGLPERTRATAFLFVPVSAAALAVTLAWTRSGPAVSTQPVVSGSLVAIVALAAVALAQRIHQGSSNRSDARLSVFL